MSEHEWRRGGPALAPVKVALDQDGCIGVRVETLTGLTRYFDPSDLIPDDRHRTPIAPEDVREGDIVRLERDGTPRAVEGPVVQSIFNRGQLFVSATKGGAYIDSPDCTLYLLSRKPTERDKWWPPQPGDVAEWSGQRWLRRDTTWIAKNSVALTDADVPDDAVLVLPARIVPGPRLTVGEVWAANNGGGRDE